MEDEAIIKPIAIKIKTDGFNVAEGFSAYSGPGASDKEYPKLFNLVIGLLCYVLKRQEDLETKYNRILEELEKPKTSPELDNLIKKFDSIKLDSGPSRKTALSDKYLVMKRRTTEVKSVETKSTPDKGKVKINADLSTNKSG